MVQIRPLLIGHFDLPLLIQYGFIRGTVNNTDKKEKRDTLTLTLSFIIGEVIVLLVVVLLVHLVVYFSDLIVHTALSLCCVS